MRGKKKKGSWDKSVTVKSRTRDEVDPTLLTLFRPARLTYDLRDFGGLSWTSRARPEGRSISRCANFCGEEREVIIQV